MSPESVNPTFLGSTRMAATEAEMAMTAPTERSTPPVAITTVMPIASRMIGALLRRMSMRLP